MTEMAKVVCTSALGLPVMAVLRAFMPDSLDLWQYFSAGVVSAMIADYWLRGIWREKK